VLILRERVQALQQDLGEARAIPDGQLQRFFFQIDEVHGRTVLRRSSAAQAGTRASHIKPWKHSTASERLDGQNGLLLAPHVDHLFDRGFISFANDGRLLASPRLERDVLKAWGITAERAIDAFSTQQQAFLTFHRENVFLPE
jgi:predicted restriction endonuclease